jgi:hypothetical protein
VRFAQQKTLRLSAGRFFCFKYEKSFVNGRIGVVTRLMIEERVWHAQPNDLGPLANDVHVFTAAAVPATSSR